MQYPILDAIIFWFYVYAAGAILFTIQKLYFNSPQNGGSFLLNQFTTDNSKIIKFYHYNVIIMKDIWVIKHLFYLV